MPVFQKNYLLIFVFLITQGLVSIIGGLVFAANPGENFIFPGVSVNGADVGGLTKEQAFKKLEQNIGRKLKSACLVLRYEDREWVFSYDQLGFRPDIRATVDKALKIGHTKNIFTDALEMFRVRRQKRELSIEYTVDELKLKNIQAGIISEINIPAKNASIDIDGSRLKINPEEPGKSYQLPVNNAKIRAALGRLQVAPVRLEVSEVRPRYTRSDLEGIEESIGLGITAFSLQNREQAENIRLAVQELNGKLIRPGEDFSFNQAIGPVIREESYRHPSVGIDGRLDRGSGAGSQVASTLYQAALYAGLQVKERHPHTVAPDYIPSGQDAAVAYGRLDLKFENNTRNPVYIYAKVKDNHIVVNLLGVRKKGQTIQLVTEQTATTLPSGLVGFKARVYRIFYDNGLEGRRELISEDDYAPEQFLKV